MRQAYLEIGNKCHCKCHMCDAHKHPSEEVPVDVVLRRIQALSSEGFNHIRLTGREPMAHPDFDKILNYMEANNVDIDITTTLLTPDMKLVERLSGISRIRVSLFALYDNHSYFYNCSPKKWQIFMSNIKRLSILRDDVIKFTYTLTEKLGRPNYSMHAAHDLIKFVRESGISKYRFEFFPDFKYINGIPKKEKKQMDSFFRQIDGYVKHKSYDIETKNIRTCSVPHHRLYVKNNGDVYPCCNAGGELGQSLPEEVLLGNIDTHQIEGMSNSVITGIDNPICNNCTKKFYQLMEA